MNAIREDKPTGAITDIYLGNGPSFRLAEALREAHIPFAFLTGYDQSAIPEDFADVPCFMKPIDTRQMIRALSKLLQAQAS